MITHCRSCGSSNLRVVLDLGRQPIANALLEDPDDPEEKYPLKLAFCAACSLLQVTETVPPDVLYQRDYPYFSSVSRPAKHDVDHVNSLIRKYNLGPRSFVVEIGSNDGYLLRNFVRQGVPCLGIDPAEGPVAAARSMNIPTAHDFFGSNRAGKLIAGGQPVDVVIANNVLAHVEDINDFVAGIALLLKPTGVAVFEFAYAVDMIRNCEFDTIYHEHVFYHTLHGLVPLFARHGLYLTDVEHLSIHGGSLRVTVGRQYKANENAFELYTTERLIGVDTGAFYEDFADRVRDIRGKLWTTLMTAKFSGRRIACYGAAAKGSTLLNYLDLGENFFEFVIDSTPYKQGKYTPGQHLKIYHPDHLLSAQPDDVLLLAWNFADKIIAQESVYRERGGRFIIPIPEPHIVPPLEKAA